MKLNSKKIHSIYFGRGKQVILSAFILVVLAGLVSGFLWMNRNGSLLKTKAAAASGPVTRISQIDNYNTIAFYDDIHDIWKIIRNVGGGSEIKAMTFDYGGVGIVYLATNPLRIERIDFTGKIYNFTNNYPGDLLKVVGFNLGSYFGVVAVQEDGIWYYLESPNKTWYRGDITNGKILCPGKVVNAGGQGTYGEMIALCDDGTMAVRSKKTVMGSIYTWANEGDLYTDEATYGNITGLDILDAGGIHRYARTISTDKGYTLLRYNDEVKFTPYPSPGPIVNGSIYPYSFAHSLDGFDFAYTEDASMAKSHFYHFAYSVGTIVGDIPGCKMKLGIPYYRTGPPVKRQFAALVRETCTNPSKPPVCGDGVVDIDMGEQCDNGSANDGTDSFCSTTCQTIINHPPVASFIATPTSGVAPLAVNFTDTSTDPDGNAITGWAWNFGDGVTSTAKNPSHTYSSAGTYTVSLIVQDSKGAFSAPATKIITVTPQIYTLTVNAGTNGTATGGGTGTAGSTKTITATPNAGYVFSSWTLTSGVGTITTTSTNPATFTFGAGNATVTANFAQQTGTIKVNSNRAITTITVGSYSGTVVTANTAVTATASAPIGSYTATCPAKTGYSITQPVSQTLTFTGTITFVCTYSANASSYSSTPKVYRNATSTWETITSPNLSVSPSGNTYVIKGASGKPLLVGDKLNVASILKDTEGNIISGSYTATCNYKKDTSSVFSACNSSTGNIIFNAATGTVDLQFGYAGIFEVNLGVTNGAFSSSGKVTITVPGIKELK